MLNYDVKDSALNVGLDTDKDGENSLDLKLHLSEAIQEAIAKGTPVEGAQVVDFRFEVTKLVLKLDTDRDGESLIDLEIDLAEAFAEIQSKFTDSQEG